MRSLVVMPLGGAWLGFEVEVTGIASRGWW